MKRISSAWLAVVVSCSDQFVLLDTEGPGANVQRDEVIIIEENVPDCGEGYEAVAFEGTWGCQCINAFLCGKKGGGTGLESSGYTVGPTSGPGAGPGGAGGMGGMGAGGTGGGTGGSEPDPCVALCSSSTYVVDTCEEVREAVRWACARTGYGLSPDSVWCFEDQDGACLGSNQLCAAGYTWDVGPAPQKPEPDPSCWPWPSDPPWAKHCTEWHSACSDQWFSFLYDYECNWVADDAANECYDECVIDCQNPSPDQVTI